MSSGTYRIVCLPEPSPTPTHPEDKVWRHEYITHRVFRGLPPEGWEERRRWSLRGFCVQSNGGGAFGSPQGITDTVRFGSTDPRSYENVRGEVDPVRFLGTDIGVGP